MIGGYGQQNDTRDRITQALMEVQNPSPRMQMPPMPGEGMNMPAVATPGTVASMGAQSPASPSFPGAQAQPQAPMAPPPQMQQPMQQPMQPPMQPPGIPPGQPGMPPRM